MYTRFDLIQLETIEQSWDGSELKIENENERVWLNPIANRQWDGDVTIEKLVNGKWISNNY